MLNNIWKVLIECINAGDLVIINEINMSLMQTLIEFSNY